MTRWRALWFAMASMAMLATACQSDATTVSAPTPTATSQPPASDAAADAPVPPTATVESALTAEPSPTPPPTSDAVPPPIAPVTLDWVLGFSPDGAYAYETLGNPWEERRPCESAPRPAIVGIDLARSDGDDLAGFVAGVEVVGNAEQLVFGSGGTGVLLSTCGEYPNEVPTLTAVRVAEGGRLVADGPGLTIAKQANDEGFWMIGVDDGAALIAATVRTGDPDGTDDPDGTWTRELRRIDARTGVIEVLDSVALDDDGGRFASPPVTSPDGRFVYREIDDPAGRLGCEGFGVAASIGIDRGQGFEPVWGVDQPAYSNILDLHFGPDDLIAWTSNCEGYGSLHVGRILDDGSIVDQHFIDTYDELPDGGFTEYRSFRLTADGHVVALGQRFDQNTDEPEPTMRRFDLADDPGFVTTGDDPPSIDTTDPLGPTLAGTGEWFIGEAPAGTTGCGDRTLYASTTAGFVRGLSVADRIDSVVDLVASERWEVDYGVGPAMRRRAVVVLTECLGLYEGRRVWFGEERPVPAEGIWLLEAELPPVADVLSVRVEPLDPDGFGVDTIAEVVFLDGSIDEIVLEPAPFD